MRPYQGFGAIVCSFFSMLVLCLAANMLPAQVLVLDTAKAEQYFVGRGVAFLEDATLRLSLDSVRSPAMQSRFRGIPGAFPNFSYTASAYWLRWNVVVANAPQQGQWLLSANYPSLEFVDMYCILPNGSITEIRCGARIPWQEKHFRHRNHIATLPEIAFGDTLTLFMRVQSRMTLAVPLEILTERRFAENDRAEMIPMWMYYGVAFAMALYNLFLFIALRDRAYLFYVLYVLFYGAFIFVSVNGLVFQQFPLYAWLVPSLVTVCSLVGNIAALLFAKEFLHLWEFGKWSVRLGWCLQAACVVGIVLHGLVPISVMHRLLNLFAVLVIVFMISNAVIAIRRGFRPAAYFLAAWMMFFTGAVIFILSNFAIIPKTPLVQFSIQIGSALEMLLLSFALGDRISLMRKEREAAQKAALQGEIYRLRTIELAEANEEIARQKEVLEEQARDIEVANAALQEQNERLRELDNEKNEFLGIAAHDLKNPLGAMRGMVEVLVMDNERMDAPDRLVFLRQTLLTIDRMVELVRNLLDINAIERGGITLSPLRLDVTSLVREVLAEYEYHAASKSLTLRFETEGEITAKVDRKALRQVLDNLISNALKYSPKGKQVTVRLLLTESFSDKPSETDVLGYWQKLSVLRIEIQDEGQGLTEQDMKRLFGKFARLSARPTGGEHSTGLGLSIVKRLVDAMNGRVWCESEHGKGAKFIVEIAG
ncbi:MAG: sensor histidine kinase [Candidatus Kapabacteria bacterium]|jgi:signal transduction histidine kinase|nr:sensor histidine kinase [Candidatus Kapabacteria bacterium]